MKLRLDDDGDQDDPILSMVNLIDVFLVVIAALMLAIANNPLNPFTADRLTVVRNAGAPDMEIITKDGNRIERYQGQGAAAGQGQGVRAGIAYRMTDGSLVYVPDAAGAAAPAAAAVPPASTVNNAARAGGQAAGPASPQGVSRLP